MDVKRLEAVARRVVMATSPFISAWELSMDVDGEELFTEMREALGITIEEWRDSPKR